MFLIKIPYKKLAILFLCILGLGMFLCGYREGKDTVSHIQIHKHPNLLEYIRR